MLSEIDEVRSQRDEAKVQNMILRQENERLTELLRYAQAAIQGNYEQYLEARNALGKEGKL